MRNDFFSKLFESYSTVPYTCMQLSLKQGAVKLLLHVVKCVPRKEKVTFANHCNFASKFSKSRPLFLYSFPYSNFLSNFRVAKRPYYCTSTKFRFELTFAIFVRWYEITDVCTKLMLPPLNVRGYMPPNRNSVRNEPAGGVI